MNQPLNARLEEAGYGILSCDCEHGTWIVIVKKDAAACIRLFCTVCNSYSCKLVAQDAEDQKQIQEAAREAQEDWGNAVAMTGKKSNGLN